MGRVFIQYRTENLRIVPVFGKAALEVSPRVGHLHYYVDDQTWPIVDTSGETVVLVGLPAGPHKVRLELADTTHRPIPGCGTVMTGSFDWIFQWRQSLQDGVYSVPGFLIRAADGSRARFVGHRPGTEIKWQATPHMWFQADYGIFYAGRFLQETKPGRNLNYWALWTGYKF